jgi:hypothetical protein
MLSNAWRRNEAVNYLNEGIIGTIFFDPNCEYLFIRPIEISFESYNSAEIFPILFLNQILCPSQPFP